jgi:hypothetical protein
MPRRIAEEEQWEDDDADRGTDEDDEPAIDCPYCKKQIHEDSLRCPYCEQYISEEDAPSSRKPWWIIIGILLCLFVVYCWIVW